MLATSIFVTGSLIGLVHQSLGNFPEFMGYKPGKVIFARASDRYLLLKPTRVDRP
jgi:hypothetical protein